MSEMQKKAVVTLGGRGFTTHDRAIDYAQSELFRPSLRDGHALDRWDLALAQEIWAVANPATDNPVPTRFFVVRHGNGPFPFELAYITATGAQRGLSIAKTLKRPFFVDRSPHLVLRRAVQGQLDRFRKGALAAMPEGYRCPVSGKKLHRDGEDVAVDHSPVQMATLRETWATLYGGIDQLHLKKTDDGYRLASVRQERDWQVWHAEHAQLRLLHQDGYREVRAEQARARVAAGGYPPMPRNSSDLTSAEIEEMTF
ncbi:hypothetical protein [Leifsonia sp. fls2-241-R2A-40a]|uniref:hypothetical protein n=1 Tax=Leifsonia sp. fls2-241-R2A-40a TaxID=3040290 RepID=UPI00254EA9C0|nr:hypothetical protein [Leifsonia sp. fls2-241-R2A-40a]